MTPEPAVRIVPFRPELAPSFRRLNLEWIERFFRVEDSDRLLLGDCEHTIIVPGGQVFFAVIEDDVVGTCAVIRHGAVSFELAKMAVTPAAQRRGIGRLLAAAALRFAQSAGADTVTLLTNSRLAPALRLYERLGFEYRQLPPNAEYERADVYMELDLPATDRATSVVTQRRRQTLDLVPGSYAICRFAVEDGLPSWIMHGAFFSVTRTPTELSAVCADAVVPSDVTAERQWSMLAVRGPLDFNLTGVLAGLATPLAAAGISIFAVSTYDTDYVLVRSHDLDRAVCALREAGHEISDGRG